MPNQLLSLECSLQTDSKALHQHSVQCSRSCIQIKTKTNNERTHAKQIEKKHGIQNQSQCTVCNDTETQVLTNE